MTSGHILSTKSKLFFTIKLISLFASRPACGIYIFLYYYNYHVDFVWNRLGSPSDLVTSWGGGCDGRMRSTSAGIGLTGHSIILYMLSGARALLIALCLQVHTKGGKLRYKYSRGRPHGHFSVSVPRNDVIYNMCITRMKASRIV